MRLAELVAEMRSSGLRALEVEGLELEVGTHTVRVRRVDLGDTIPAPPSFDDVTETAIPKPAGSCAHSNCEQPAGWRLAPDFCRHHGMQLAGVRVT